MSREDNDYADAMREDNEDARQEWLRERHEEMDLKDADIFDSVEDFEKSIKEEK